MIIKALYYVLVFLYGMFKELLKKNNSFFFIRKVLTFIDI